MLGSLSDLERRLAVPYAVLMIGANIVGAVIVTALIRFVLPLPHIDDPHHVTQVNMVWLAGYLAIAVPVGVVWVLWLLRPVLAWLRADRPPTPEEQRLVLLTPAREVVAHGVLWGLSIVLFFIINSRYSHKLAVLSAITIALGALATCAFAYLLAQRVLRPVAARALADSVPDDPALPGITTRVLLTWALGSAVPVLGVTLVGAGQLTGAVEASAHRLAITATVLGAIALLVGVAVMALTARSLSDPLESLRRAVRRVQGGEQDAEVDVYDGSEVGLLQAGFNRMVSGLREREELRDLFGRQVGEDVARQALERGITLGGEEIDVAVLFIDLVGSTELAHQRPPAEVVELLNEFFHVVIDVVDEQGGTVNKFIGDAALVVFGAPLHHDDAAGAALRAARTLRLRLAEEVPHLDVGIGVSAGLAVAGNIGAQQRFEYTVIGDPVNEASRLTELAKQHDGRVLASRAALERADADERRRWGDVGEETLRGRAEPTRLAAPA
ncbi:MAG TPA: adenylate/guanylate cyclase domain-containing protein [Baekduia sp.]|uniref:adenylate/guanylate cyclase domain-containing protein n=1 Tax=Baekduia sp. TaxID=2600305 RepID=UPI002D78714B|nr:adenylate/guanylate cyclase domain-containing protein [Baekduia sp.]HET6506416.1 adenylate/guanylate cyclase domain-containing protein [Baekduia sp.]